MPCPVLCCTGPLAVKQQQACQAAGQVITQMWQQTALICCQATASRGHCTRQHALRMKTPHAEGTGVTTSFCSVVCCVQL